MTTLEYWMLLVVRASSRRKSHGKKWRKCVSDNYSVVRTFEANDVNILVNIDVPDVNSARRFYEGGLGFSFKRSLFDGAVAELAAGGVTVFLIEAHQGTHPVSGAGPVRDYAAHWTPVHLDLVVEDVHAAVDRAVQAGATLERPLQVHEWGKLAGLRDPFGHGICVLEFTDDGYDLVIARQR